MFLFIAASSMGNWYLIHVARILNLPNCICFNNENYLSICGCENCSSFDHIKSHHYLQITPFWESHSEENCYPFEKAIKLNWSDSLQYKKRSALLSSYLVVNLKSNTRTFAYWCLNIFVIHENILIGQHVSGVMR